MRKIILISIILMAELVVSSLVQAQGTLYVSNLGQTPTGSAAVSSDSWVAQSFTTGTNAGGYMLNSVQLFMDVSSGNPNGFMVSIYNGSVSPFSPTSSIGSLNGADPSAGGLFTYTASDIMLSPTAFYFVVVTAATPVAEGAYGWSNGAFGPQSGIDGWSIFGVSANSTDGLSWQASRQYTFQMAIYATAIPEPATLALAELGLAALSFRRRKGW